MEGAKIQLSAAEMALLNNAELILTKNNILQKTRTVFEELQQLMQHEHQLHLAESPLLATGPKISRGENYLGLPYIVLDFPRNFGQPDTMVVRSFFWWGHFFSSTLQLSGSYQQALAPRIAAAYPQLVARDFFVQVGTDPWAHHFEPDNYQPVSAFGDNAFASHCRQHPHIKIAAKWPLSNWPFAAMQLFENWKLLLAVCGV